MPEPAPAIVWFRRDLRLTDNPALAAACATGASLIPVYILDEARDASGRLGTAQRWWLGESLASLGAALAAAGSALVLRQGPPAAALVALARETSAGDVYLNRVPEPWAEAEDAELAVTLAQHGIAVHAFDSALLFDPAPLGSASGRPYAIFTAFWRACCRAATPARPIAAPVRLRRWPHRLRSEAKPMPPAGLDLAALRNCWRPGSAGAAERLAAFLDDGLEAYAVARDRPDRAGTSRLSPHLRFGEISPREVWHAAHAHAAALGPRAGRGLEAFIRELGWREFSYYLLRHHPDLGDAPLRPAFRQFPWAADPALVAAWREGRTGYPIVDAGMRELRATGWMPNRVRMIAASFLIKDLLQPWQEGAAWFRDRLVDADPANNAASWQWVAGCGADAAPFFRIFNPSLQGEKFDPEGDYVRRWVLELAHLPAPKIHRPWLAAGTAREPAKRGPGLPYPAPIVDHAAARVRALAAFRQIGSRSHRSPRRPRASDPGR